MEHLDLAGVLTTPPQWNLPAFEQQDAIYLSSSRQMLEPIMEETSEDEEYALNSWHQYEQQSSDAECGHTTEGESVCGGTSGNGGASFWSSAESDTGSVIRIEINKDNDSTSERDFLCPAKRPRRCEESLPQILPEEEVILRKPLYNGVEKNNSLERFLNYENFARDSWGANSQQRSSVGSRRGFDDFYSDSDSLSYNSLSRSSSLIQFESLERQLLMQEQHASMNSLGNSSPSLLSFENTDEVQSKVNSGNNSANNSRRGSQSSLLKKYESLDGRLHQTYYDLDKLNFDDMDNANSDNFSRNTNLKISPHMAELRSDSESSSEGSEGSPRPRSVLSPGDSNDNEFLFKRYNKTNSQQSKKGKNSAENLSEDSGYCEPSLGFGLRRSKSQTLLKNYEKFSEEEEEMENKSLIYNHKQQFNIELNDEQEANKHSIENEFKNKTNTRHEETLKTPPLSPHLEFIRHKQRSETHSPSPVSSEVSTSSSTASTQSANSNNSSTSSSSSSSSAASSASSTSSATTCASKASFTWLMPSNTASHSPKVLPEEEENFLPLQISLNDLRELQTSNNENVQIFNGNLKNLQEFENENECLECLKLIELKELNEYCCKCGEKVLLTSFSSSCKELFKCQKCLASHLKKDLYKNSLKNKESEQRILVKRKICENCGENLKLFWSLGEQEKAQVEKIKHNSNSLKCLNLKKSCSSSLETDNFVLNTESVYNPLMPSWLVKCCSVPNELNTIGRKKKLKRKQQQERKSTDSLMSTSNENLFTDAVEIKRSSSWCGFTGKELHTSDYLLQEAKNLTLLHQSYHNLALLDLDCTKDLLSTNMSERRISSDYETEIVCKNNFLLDELSEHYDRTASILNDRTLDLTDGSASSPQAPERQKSRKMSNSSCSANEESESEQVQHVQLVIRKPPARQKRSNQDPNKTNSLTQDFSFNSIMQEAQKTFDQDPTILKTSYAQSLEKCNFDCKELSQQDLSKRSLPKRRFHSQANNAKKKSLVSSTPNLNAYDFNHQDEIEDDMFVSSAHTSMHQLPLSQTQKPLGILLPAGSRTSFGKEVSFCPVVSKYCWQEQSSEECNDGTEEYKNEGEESEDELLDNADATVIYNTKENENIANKYNEEIMKNEHQHNKQMENNDTVSKEKAILKEINIKKQVENVMVTKEQQEREQEINVERVQQTDLEREHERVVEDRLENETPQLEKEEIVNKQEEQIKPQEHLELQTTSTKLLSQETTTSLTTNVNNETLKTLTDNTDTQLIQQNKLVNLQINSNTSKVQPTVVVARPLSIQLPILSEPPINRAHHILYASQQMLDNFQKQQENEEYQHLKITQSTQNISKMSSKTNEVEVCPQNKLNNNNEIMKSKFKHEEKHPNSKGFLSRFANGFRFSLRRNKKKLPTKENQQQVGDLQQTNQNKTNSLPPNHKSPDFIHIPLKGPLPQQRNGNYSNKQTNGNSITNGNNNKNNTVVATKQKGGKTKETSDKQQQKVTGKPPIPPHQQQQLQKLQSAQSSQQQPLVEVGLSRFYTETENNPTNPLTITQDFLNNEQNHNQQQQQLQQQQFTTITTNTTPQSCANHHQQLNENLEENVANMTTATVNTNNTATYEFNASPSRASVSQKTQMFNNLSRKSEPQQPKIGLIETNLDTHETIITGKTRSLINIGPNQLQQQQRYAGNKRLHTTLNSSAHNHQYNRHLHHNDGNEADDDDYDDNDDDEVVVRPDGTVVVIKNAGKNGTSSSSSQAAQIVSVRRPHKSMEFLLDKENQKDVMPPENELQKSHDHNPAALSEHQLRIQASLQRLNIPDWFRQYNQKSPDANGSGASTYKPGNFTRKRTQDSGRWVGLNSKTTSLSSLGSQRSDRSPLLLSPSAQSHHGGHSTQHAGQHGHGATSATGSSGGAFSRWSTSHLNSSQTSPSVSSRGSFTRGGPINSSFISINSGNSVIRNSMRQPYLGWRSQEKLSQRTAHERLASSLLSQQQRTSPTTHTTVPVINDKLQPVTPEIQSSIKEVTSAIVHYVNDQTNQQRSRSTSPNSRKCWLESSFVGIRPLDTPQTPIIENVPLITGTAAVASSSPSSLTTFRPSLLHNNNNNNNLQYANPNLDGSLNLSSLGNDVQLIRMNGGLKNGISSSSTAGGVNLGGVGESKRKTLFHLTKIQEC